MRKPKVILAIFLSSITFHLSSLNLNISDSSRQTTINGGVHITNNYH